MSVGQDTDGISVLIDRDDTASVTAIHTELTRQARLLQVERGGTRAARTGQADARIGACRADVLKTLVLGARDPRPTGDTADANDDATTSSTGPAGVDGPGDSTPHGPGAADTPGRSLEPAVRPLEGHLVIDLATLRREAERPGLLDGSAIPAPMGRELARAVRAWRRIVTDPVTGHLLDYGRRVYLPPAWFSHPTPATASAPPPTANDRRRAVRWITGCHTPTGRRTPRTAATCATATTPSRPTATSRSPTAAATAP